MGWWGNCPIETTVMLKVYPCGKESLLNHFGLFFFFWHLSHGGWVRDGNPAMAICQLPVYNEREQPTKSKYNCNCIQILRSIDLKFDKVFISCYKRWCKALQETWE